MNIELELHDKYAEKLEAAKDVDSSVKDRIIMQLEQEAMSRIQQAEAEAKQIQAQKEGQQPSELAEEAPDP